MQRHEPGGDHPGRLRRQAEFARHSKASDGGSGIRLAGAMAPCRFRRESERLRINGLRRRRRYLGLALVCPIATMPVTCTALAWVLRTFPCNRARPSFPLGPLHANDTTLHSTPVSLYYHTTSPPTCFFPHSGLDLPFLTPILRPTPHHFHLTCKGEYSKIFSADQFWSPFDQSARGIQRLISTASFQPKQARDLAAGG